MKNINSKNLLFICFISAMGGYLFGYDWVVIGGAKIFYEPFFAIEDSAALRGWAMSSALLGCLVGAGFSGSWSDKYGRKKLLILSALLFLLSAVGTGAVDNFSWFIFYRIVGGLGIGIASNVSPIYIAEVSPTEIRGKLVSLNQLTIVLGILSAQLANWMIANLFTEGTSQLPAEGIEQAWRWMFWAEALPAALFFILAFIIPESPRWLAAKEVKEKYDWRALSQPGVRRVLILGIVLAVFQQWCGINVIFNYAHEVFSAAGYEVSDVLMNIVITGVTNVIFTFVAIYTVDHWGRRTLMLIGSTGLDLSHSKYEGTNFGFTLGGGAFVADNFAVLLNFKGQYVEHGTDETSIGAQGRYYLSSCGVYGGLGMAYKHLSSGDYKKNLVCLTPEVGYAFFLGRNLTVEPAVYYDLSFNHTSEYSKLGFKIGFGLYF